MKKALDAQAQSTATARRNSRKKLLKLHRETLAVLSDNDLEKVAGGGCSENRGCASCSPLCS